MKIEAGGFGSEGQEIGNMHQLTIHDLFKPQTFS